MFCVASVCSIAADNGTVRFNTRENRNPERETHFQFTHCTLTDDSEAHIIHCMQLTHFKG